MAFAAMFYFIGAGQARITDEENMVGKLVSCFVGAVAIAFISSSTYGQGLIQQCNGCTSSQIYNLATALGVGHHLIGDFTDDVILGYRITREPAGKGGYLLTVDPEDVTSLSRSGFEDYRKLIVDYHSSAIVVVVPNPRPSGYPTALDGISAVDWARIPNYQNAMDVWFTNLQTQSVATDWLPGAGSVALLAMQSGVTVDAYDPTITFTIQTTAGAIIRLKWDDGKTTLQSVVDQYGNTIPIMKFDGPTNFAGRYVFSDANPGYTQSLVNYLNSLGANISINPSQFPSWYICVGAKCDVQPN